jgi:hypothetical protein
LLEASLAILAEGYLPTGASTADGIVTSEMSRRWRRGTILVVMVGLAGCSSSGTNAPSTTGYDASAPNDGRAAETADASDCVPCMGHIGPLMDLDACTQVKDPAPGAIQGAMVDMQVAAGADGTCMLDSIALQCGGTGTFADGTPLTWTLANGVVTFQDSTRVFTCVVQ